MTGLTEEGRRIVAEVAQRHGVSEDAVRTLLMALVAGHGTQAQFNHSDLGGMGQWSQGGMIMVGDMFNQGLKYRVDSLCTELANLLRGTAIFAQAPMSSQSQSQSGGYGGGGVSLFVPGSFGNRWPAELGTPSSAGSQNDLHYAVFPATRRLAIERGGQVTVYDTGDHAISGFSQQQGGGQSLTFTSQYGLVSVADLRVVTPDAAPAAEPAPPPEPEPSGAAADHSASPEFQPRSPEPVVTPARAAAPATSQAEDDIFGKLERLADLCKKDIITAEEFAAKKAELLARL